MLLHRLPRLGIPNQPPPAASPIRKILCSLHFDLGIDPELFCRCQQLLRCYRYPLYARCIRSRCDAGLCTLNFPGTETHPCSSSEFTAISYELDTMSQANTRTVVYKTRTRQSRQHLVQLQRRGPDLRRSSRVRHRRRS